MEENSCSLSILTRYFGLCIAMRYVECCLNLNGIMHIKHEKRTITKLKPALMIKKKPGRKEYLRYLLYAMQFFQEEIKKSCGLSKDEKKRLVCDGSIDEIIRLLKKSETSETYKDRSKAVKMAALFFLKAKKPLFYEVLASEIGGKIYNIYGAIRENPKKEKSESSSNLTWKKLKLEIGKKLKEREEINKELKEEREYDFMYDFWDGLRVKLNNLYITKTEEESTEKRVSIFKCIDKETLPTLPVDDIEGFFNEDTEISSFLPLKEIYFLMPAQYELLTGKTYYEEVLRGGVWYMKKNSNKEFSPKISSHIKKKKKEEKKNQFQSLKLKKPGSEMNNEVVEERLKSDTKELNVKKLEEQRKTMPGKDKGR